MITQHNVLLGEHTARCIVARFETVCRASMQQVAMEVAGQHAGTLKARQLMTMRHCVIGRMMMMLRQRRMQMAWSLSSPNLDQRPMELVLLRCDPFGHPAWQAEPLSMWTLLLNM